jgi:hypothetical protein
MDGTGERDLLRVLLVLVGEERVMGLAVLAICKYAASVLGVACLPCAPASEEGATSSSPPAPSPSRLHISSHWQTEEEIGDVREGGAGG